MKKIVIVPILFCVSICVGCAYPHGYYEANLQIVEKGIATDNNPTGMNVGNLWAKGGNGYIRFADKEIWNSITVAEFYIIRFDRNGWVTYAYPSKDTRDFVIVGNSF